MKRLVVASFVLALLVSGCNEFNAERGRGDAPVGERNTEESEVMFFPDKFSNVAHKCDGYGHRVYVTTSDYSTVVVVDDPSCAQ